MKSFNTKAVILGHKDFGETDKLITMYTESFGKLKIIAKGAKKITSKFTGHLETLNICNVNIYFGPRNIILTEIVTLKNNKAIRENLNKLEIILQIAEITDTLCRENQNIEDLFSLLTNTLHHLKNSDKTFLTLSTFALKLMNYCGLIPNFKEIDSKLETKYLKFFEFIKNKNFVEIDHISTLKEEEKNIKTITRKILEYNANIKIKSLSTQLN